MFLAIERPIVAPTQPDAVATPYSPPVENPCPRALHARLLANAAARRLRAVERARAHRQEDAAYWKAACPMVVARAAALREARSFAPLP